MFGGEKQPAISCAVIRNGNGVVGAALSENTGRLSGLLLEDTTVIDAAFPHVPDSDLWGSELTVFNPLGETATLTVQPYDQSGTALTSASFLVAPYDNYVGAIGADISLPSQTAWVALEGSTPFTAAASFFHKDGGDFAAYCGVGSSGTHGVFPKLEALRWTGIALANNNGSEASVTLTAYDDDGAVVATQPISIAAYGRIVGAPDRLFTQDIAAATYVTYDSNNDLAGFQLNGSPGYTMLDALPAAVSGAQ
jgi:hypothetical protein